jgi:hypothetical protein
MDTNQDPPKPSDSSQPELHQTTEFTPEKEAPPDVDLDLPKLLQKMQKDIEEVKGNSTSEKNISTLDKVEKGIDKLTGFLETFSLPSRSEEKKEDPVIPESPEIEMPDMPQFEYIRRRGGRVVKRQVGK